jgi:alanine racemase
VKADAYGHGLVPVARALRGAGADGLCVATLDEAIALRRAGVGGPILVLYPVPPGLVGEAARRGIGLTMGDRTLLERSLAAIDAAHHRGPPLRIHVEVETGLGRGGFDIADLDPAVAAIRAAPGVRLTGVWSHLAAPDDRPRSDLQVERFEAGLGRIGPARREAAPARHLAATGGLVTGAAPAYDAVRPGLAIYGIVPEGLPLETLGSLAAGLRPVLSLHARPVRVLDLPAGHGVSYGPSFTTARPSRIATLPLGYGDGWPRSLSNRAEALVRGVRVPLVGTVAMDAVMADVTDVPGSPVGVDDAFTLIGEQGEERISARDVAQSRTTISWEVVTSIAGRVPRVYHAAAAAVGVRTLVDERYP